MPLISIFNRLRQKSSNNNCVIFFFFLIYGPLKRLSLNVITFIYLELSLFFPLVNALFWRLWLWEYNIIMLMLIVFYRE